MTAGDLARSAHRHFLKRNQFALSVYSREARDKASLAANVMHQQIRVSSVGAIRAVGFDVISDGRPDHCLILFPNEPSQEDLERLTGCFSEPEPNPAQEA
jgi:hypothetical protein